ncbi:MAG: trigger factor [Pseudohaliea sp.]
MKTPAINSSGARIVGEEVDGLHHRFHVELDPEAVRAAVDEQLRRAAPRLEVPGFRRGRAPLTVLRNHHGTRARDSIVDRLAIAITRSLIAERGLSPRARPSIHIDAKAPESFLLSLEVAPAIEPGNLADIHVQRLEVTGADDELQAMAREHERRQLFDALTEHYRFPVPGDMIDNERERISAGYLEAVGEAPDPSTERELAAIAERRVRLALLFAELARRHAISVARSDVEQLVEGLADRDPAHQEEIIDYYLDHPTAMAELQSPLLEQRVTDFILAHCTVTVEKVSEAQLRQRVSAAAMP